MNFTELLEKYQAVVAENNSLKEELKKLKEQLSNSDCQAVSGAIYDKSQLTGGFPSSGSELLNHDAEDEALSANINKLSDPNEKIKLFMSLFKGRDDVYAKRWENKKKGIAGYSPFCLHEWKVGFCVKPQKSCTACQHKAYARFDEKIVEKHLRGHDSFVAGLYPLLADETCCFLAIDFDDDDWQKDISALRDGCSDFDIPIAVERSRSGNGAHAWFFFKQPISAATARKFGTALLTYAMSKRHEIAFRSYDKLFPNQDTIPKGGLGNLIALPLQGVARSRNNSEFIDDDFNAYSDQWAFLGSVPKFSAADIEALTAKLCNGNELGVLKKDDEEVAKPWETNKVKLVKADFPQKLEIVQANMLFIPKVGFSEKALNHLKRLAAFKNPEFFKMQAMRMPIGRKPRVISCAEETSEYLCLPRGCEADIQSALTGFSIDVNIVDKTNWGSKIDVAFKGDLRDEQPLALEKLLEYNTGVLCGTTAFGKTVVAIKLIAERKVNTLILVDKVSLVEQWKKRLLEFLTINETLPDMDGQFSTKRGRKKGRSIIGQLGAGKNSLSGVIDIAVIQSLNRLGEVKDCVRNYGMVIVDECHHISAVSFEKVLNSTDAKYVHGLTATPTRKDGHHPIIFMQCGAIRYRDDAKKQAERRPFAHYVLPRFTSLRIPLHKDEKDVTIHDLYAEIAVNELRNEQIIADVVKCHENGRNCIVLTERTAHVELLAKELSKRIRDVIFLTGGLGTRETRDIMQKIVDIPPERPLTLVATGKYIGEGFDEPRLDTLFLAMPISWKGTLQQYAGRLHRLFAHKNEVQIYDYVDIHVRMLEKMYHKRLNGYAAIGYKAKGETALTDAVNIIFGKSNFLPVYMNDILNAHKGIVIVSPFVTKRRTLQMVDSLQVAVRKNVTVTIVTRPVEDFEVKNRNVLIEALKLLEGIGIHLVYKTKIHQKFAVIDQRTVWYGSINLMSFGSAEESIMRLDSANIACELIKSIDGQ